MLEDSSNEYALPCTEPGECFESLRNRLVSEIFKKKWLMYQNCVVRVHVECVNGGFYLRKKQEFLK